MWRLTPNPYALTLGEARLSPIRTETPGTEDEVGDAAVQKPRESRAHQSEHLLNCRRRRNEGRRGSGEIGIDRRPGILPLNRRLVTCCRRRIRDGICKGGRIDAVTGTDGPRTIALRIPDHAEARCELAIARDVGAGAVHAAVLVKTQPEVERQVARSTGDCR